MKSNTLLFATGLAAVFTGGHQAANAAGGDIDRIGLDADFADDGFRLKFARQDEYRKNEQTHSRQ